jgi:hypothetical protein
LIYATRPLKKHLRNNLLNRHIDGLSTIEATDWRGLLAQPDLMHDQASTTIFRLVIGGGPGKEIPMGFIHVTADFDTPAKSFFFAPDKTVKP